MSGELAIAVITAAGVEGKQVFCKNQPTPQEVNLLFALSEHVNKIISADALCARLKISENSLRINATRLRRKLAEEWTIVAVPNKGYRLIYVGGELLEADRTFIEIEKELLDPRPGPPALRVRRSPEACQRMREAAIRNKTHERFYRHVV